MYDANVTKRRLCCRVMSSKKSLVPSPFTLERFAAQYEFCTPHLLCCSDAEAWSMSDVIKEADDDCKSLWDNLDLIYTHSQGHPLLLKEIAALHNVNVEDITVGAPQECIYIGIHSIVEYLHKLVLYCFQKFTASVCSIH